jgi:hypothetical protein
MGIFKKLFFLITILATKIVFASPSQTNHFQLNFKGADAENFKSGRVFEKSSEYGANSEHSMHDYTFSFIKKMGDSGYRFVFTIECQQRVLDYRSQNPNPLAPACTFFYFTEAPENVSSHSNIEMYTNIDMTADVSKRMIQKFSWSEHRDSGSFYFGCRDNTDSGCPTITYTPSNGSEESSVEVIYYKP